MMWNTGITLKKRTRKENLTFNQIPQGKGENIKRTFFLQNKADCLVCEKRVRFYLRFFILTLLTDGSILKAKVIRPMPGLGVFKHNAVGIKGLAGDDCQKIVIL